MVPRAGVILIVEDDLDVRESLIDILEEEGYEVAGATDGLAALSYLGAAPAPALILLDWRMPRCDGAEFLQRWQSHPFSATVPVVLLTADARTEGSAALPRGSVFLKKPVKLDDLLSTVKKFFGGEGPRA